MIPRKSLVLQAGCLLVLFLSTPYHTLASAEAEPEAEAEAEAQPEALPDADADPQQLLGGRPQYGPLSPCQMTNQCCGMDNKNCCVGGQKCFNKLVRVCDGDGEQDCQVSVRQKCFNERIKDCRVIPEVVTRTFKASVCTPKPLRKCFPYQRKECTPSYTNGQKTLTWENEKLVKTQDVPKTECIPINSYDCKNIVRVVNDTIQVRKTRVVPFSQRFCRLMPHRLPDRQEEIPQVYTKYERRCFSVDVPSCSQSPCQLRGACPPTQSVCSQTQYNTNTVCPFSAQASQNRPNILPAGVNAPGFTNYPVPTAGGQIMPGPGAGASCQQVRQPVCGSVGGSCNVGAQQQCCGTRKQQVCRNVPVRLTRTITHTIPGRTEYKNECRTENTTREEPYFEPQIVSRNITEKDCEQVQKTECLNYTIPVYGVNADKKTAQVTVQLPECRQRLVNDEFCHTFPTGDFDCQPQEVTKAFRINKIKCDQEVTKPFCILVPSLNCRPGAPRCRMVSKQVCQKSCSQSAQCQQCDAFAQGSGFGTCSSSTCGNVYLPPVLSGSIGGQGSYNGGSYGSVGGGSVGGSGSYGGSIGGQGSYDGGVIGGQGSYDGGVIGGQGSYDGGVVGGQGSYDGGYVGGQGSYPGLIGGSGSYGGSVGGQGSYGGIVGGYGGSGGYGYGYQQPGGLYPGYNPYTGALPEGDVASGPNPMMDVPEAAAAPESLEEPLSQNAEEEAAETLVN